jgi:hypothetical protein
LSAVCSGQALNLFGFAGFWDGSVLKSAGVKAWPQLCINSPFGSLGDQKCRTLTLTPLAVDPIFGSFSYPLYVTRALATEFKFGHMTVNILVCRDGGEAPCNANTAQSAGSAVFVLSDPRPPTSTMKLVTPAFVQLGSPFKVSGTAESLLGTPVKGAEIVLAYSVDSQSRGACCHACIKHKPCHTASISGGTEGDFLGAMRRS